MSSDGDQVVVLYDMVTTTPAGTQLVCEWYRVDDDRIAWIRARFDPRRSRSSARARRRRGEAGCAHPPGWSS